MNLNILATVVQYSQEIIILISSTKKIMFMNNAAKIFLTKQYNICNIDEKFCFGSGSDEIMKHIFSHSEIEKFIDHTFEKYSESIGFVEWTVKKIFDESEENVFYYCLTGYDLTRVKKLQAQMFNLENIINSSPGFVFWKDKSCVLQGCNQNFAEQVGLQYPKEIAGKTDYDLPWSKEETERFLTDDKEVMSTGIAKINIEENQTQKDGKTSTLLTSKIPLCDENNVIIGVLGTYFDITERKRAEKLAVERKILEEKFKVSQNLAGVMAHELRTPIATFKLYADLIKSVIQNPEMSFEDKQNNIVELVEKCYEVEKSSTQFIDMILYRLRSTNNKLDPARFDLCLIADDIEDVLDTYAFGSGERALITVKKANAFTYKGDSVATKHIVSNLIKNTLKIIKEEDKGKITISFDQSDEKYNKMIFEDDAKGIDEKFLPLIFDSFVYKDSTGKGTGLGLAFCKMIMVDYGGDIICESELGKYTRFICLFPKVDMNEFDFA